MKRHMSHPERLRLIHLRIALATICLLLGRCDMLPPTGSPARISFGVGRDGPGNGKPHRACRWNNRSSGATCLAASCSSAGGPASCLKKRTATAAVEPEKVPMTTDTVFDMASLTKPVATATSVMILIERGQLRLQDKVAKFFPEFAANGKENVTIEQLLVHSAGLIPDNSLERLRRRLEVGQAENLRS